MFAHERNHLPAHVITIERVNVDAIEKTLGRRHARFLVSARTPASLEELSRRRFPKIVGQRGEHHRHLPRISQIVDQRACAIDRQLRVYKHIAFGMPFRILRHSDQALYLRKEFLDRTELSQPFKPDRRTLRAEQKFFEFAPDSFGRQIAKLDTPTKFDSVGMNVELETGCELGRSQYSQTVFGERVARHCTQHALLNVSLTFERIDQLAGEWILKDRVDREIAATRGFCNTHRRITFDHKTLVTGS